MRIGFDVSQTAGEKAGCGFLADQLIRHLVFLDKSNEYLLYPTFYKYRSRFFCKASKPESPHCQDAFCGMPFHIMVSEWEAKVDDRTRWLGSPDIVHSNNFSCVKDHKARIVYTLYDVTPLLYPEFTTEENRLICFDGLFNASIYADHCIAISEHTKNSFLNYFPHYPDNRITVIPLGTRPTISITGEPDNQRKILEKFNIESDFWLGVGTIEPRKNYRLLIDAYYDLHDSRPLVIAGGKGWLESDIGDRVKDLGIQDKVKFLGYVSEDELSALYSSCFAFVYPSYFEGFGLPVLEAMACGAAVIASSSSSLPEVGGNSVLYIDPRSKESLAQAMRSLAENPVLLRNLRLKSLERAKKFSWHDAARITLEVYKKTIEMKQWLI